MRFLAKLRTANAPEVYCIFNDYDLVRKNGVNQNNAAKLMFYKAVYNVAEPVMKRNTPLMREDFEVVSVEEWPETESRVVRGNNKFIGFAYNVKTNESMNIGVDTMSGVKSAYNRIIGSLSKKCDTVVIIYQGNNFVKNDGLATKNTVDVKKTFYHGTDAQFETFDVVKTQPGFWFTEDKAYASTHGKYLIKVTLDIKKPLDLEKVDIMKPFEKCFKGKDFNESLVFSKTFRDYLVNENYDSLMWKHHGFYTVVVFHSKQIGLFN
ncbi:hypothetical protein SAMN02745136_00462 [Anaerocolumna jejuensis DSM 15929]|uniref:ART-PolyVal-like domain-containing protein n=2 Tax=Anaerocolumna TaxID=1843210 RepID=A0A1M6KI72_9FIRM|nr:hypothetical protein SAMN02745136_00462 [Anaerocolumna jejuensis DSM 15929]